MKEIGGTMPLMEMENISMLLGLYMKDNGKIINKMEKVLKFGQMELDMKENLLTEKNLARVN